MQIKTDVLVIGSGMAGLTAALAAASNGCQVTIAASGAGALAISSGCIDLLGQFQGQEVSDPWEVMSKLPPTHPYALLGCQRVAQALDSFQAILSRRQAAYLVAQKDGKKINSRLPTIVGTLKPSYLIPQSLDSSKLFSARQVLVAGIEGLRDLSPKLCAHELAQLPEFSQSKFSTTLLPSPFSQTHRGLSSLDLARRVSNPEGQQWLETCLGRFAGAYDAILVPPILGISASEHLVSALREKLHCHIQELLTIPPGVGGIRLREILVNEARERNIRSIENVRLNRSCLSGQHCEYVAAHQEREENLRFYAKSFVLATGGILGGGLWTTPDHITEELFDLPVASLPEGQARTSPDVLASHPISQAGLRVDSCLHPIDAQGQRCLDNVFVAGRSIGGYDPADEKSGFGVAIATGWHAGLMAAEVAGLESRS
ncbi:MAG: anaerobic glycerol-3-phosphate dehydrogenase subunit B [Desulfovibrio sp.]|nr:anaerobic glycerol-3-phosphate dehydrogenase subunit B [Desulfovibrio sp.]